MVLKKKKKKKKKKNDVKPQGLRFLVIKKEVNGKIEKIQFPMVECGLTVLRILYNYLQCVSQVKAIGADVVAKLVEILSLFNSRTCQLVLGAGAMHMAGLKSITTKHLALAARAVQLVSTLIPVIKSVLLSQLPPKQHILLQPLDRIQADYINHGREVQMKFVSIMEELLEHSGQKFLQSDWAQPRTGAADVPLNTQPDKWAKSLMGQTETLHKTLQPLLTPQDCGEVFSYITDKFNLILSRHFNQIDLSRQYTRLRLSYNVTHIVIRYRSIVSREDACKELEKFMYHEKG